MTESEMFARLGELRDARDEAKTEYDKRKDEHDRFQHSVVQYMKDRKNTSYGTESEQWIRRSTRYAQVTNLDALIKWAEENGLEDEFLKPKEVAARLNELVRQLTDDGQELPPGVDFYDREYIARTTK